MPSVYEFKKIFENLIAFFRWAVVVAMLTTSFAVILIVVGSALDIKECSKVTDKMSHGFEGILASVGTFMFGLGGHVVFPTIQHDMKNPRQFKLSAVLAFLSTLY